MILCPVAVIDVHTKSFEMSSSDTTVFRDVTPCSLQKNSSGTSMKTVDFSEVVAVHQTARCQIS
jgi:hypothetical protein